MSNLNSKSMLTLGIFIFFGLISLGYFLVESVNVYKEYDRTVTVKGLSQKDFKADIILWPIKFSTPDKDLFNLNKKIEGYTNIIVDFLEENGIKKDEINIQAPAITDKLANDYANRNFQYRYLGNRTINVYSKNVQKVRDTISKLSQLNKKGIIFNVNGYDTRVEYMFTRLNEVKPSMIEESTKKAREVALKFAKDSNSKLGKIKKARQGQFSIFNRDKNTPHIKTVRVVSSVEYYLND
ncbi:SIMPL domain-containing protein [Arcobacter sp. LA11]|uniref:SIMPL domain-containing protein n=1 Tax=Arcobacter sp. LA11 TaxID=1898176 RepID=UPI0009350E5E|nr:SIMPL domain-containing protein [Arcobacter sp. LA11]